MRRIASAMSQVGSTVEKIAIASDSAWMRSGTSSADSGRVSTNCARTNTVEASIAQAMKRIEPSRPMMPPAPTR